MRAAADRLLPWARGPGRCWVHRSDDGGRTWAHSVEVDTAPFVGGYGMRGGVVLPDGAILLPLGDIPDYRRVFVVRSEDAGASWSAAVPVAAMADRLFEEPAPLLLRSGRVLVLLGRTGARACGRSGPMTVAAPGRSRCPPGIDGYPAHLCQLPDGRLLCTYGFRRPPFAIRAVLSTDDGASWPEQGTIEIRSGLPNRDLGYPCTVCSAERLLSIYYTRDASGVTGIHGTGWRMPENSTRSSP